MRVALGSDHAGFELKQEIADYVRGLGHEVVDVGTNDREPVDYPDYAQAVANVLSQGRADRGILICGSGVGASITANKVAGIRAGLCHDTYSTHQGVEHDDMNVLVMGARVIGSALAKELVRTYLQARFTAEERHLRRLRKIQKIEELAAGKSDQKDRS